METVKAGQCRRAKHVACCLNFFDLKVSGSFYCMMCDMAQDSSKIGPKIMALGRGLLYEKELFCMRKRSEAN